MKLTVIISDVAPLEVLQEPVRHRSVSIEFTAEQLEKLKLNQTGFSMGKPIMEQYSSCFIEEISISDDNL